MLGKMPPVNFRWHYLLFKFYFLYFCRKCGANILSAVDNYAVLCLDIVWCYLCLQNIEELPDAGLSICNMM